MWTRVIAEDLVALKDFENFEKKYIWMQMS